MRDGREVGLSDAEARVQLGDKLVTVRTLEKKPKSTDAS
jgi:hypothetical protein